MKIILAIILFLNQPPVVTITSHVTNQIVQSGEITIKASATDADGIAKVVFYVGTSQVGTDTRSPYSATVNLTPGKYTLKAKAYDKLGASRTVSVTIDVRDLAMAVSNSIQTLTTRLNALEGELKKQKDSLTALRKYVNIEDTTIFDNKFQVIHDSPHKHHINLK